jgi:hypothetical protein
MAWPGGAFGKLASSGGNGWGLMRTGPGGYFSDAGGVVLPAAAMAAQVSMAHRVVSCSNVFMIFPCRWVDRAQWGSQLCARKTLRAVEP